jgi:hypothetical protein
VCVDRMDDEEEWSGVEGEVEWKEKRVEGEEK